MKNNILGELEQRIMNIVWDSNDSLRPVDVNLKLEDQYAYSTVVTILTRLYQKGILDRAKKGKVYFYYPKKSREEFAHSKLKLLFKGILSDYGELAISQFVDSLEESPEDLDNLRTYLKSKKQ